MKLTKTCDTEAFQGCIWRSNEKGSWRLLFGWWRVRRLWIPFWEDCMNKVQYCKLPRTMRSCASNYSRNTDSGEEGRLFSGETTPEPDKAERRIDSVDVSRNGKVREIESLFTRDGLAFVSLSKTRHS